MTVPHGRQYKNMYKIPEQLRNALIDYLLSRPMSEVEGAVAALRNLEKVEPTNKR